MQKIIIYSVRNDLFTPIDFSLQKLSWDIYIAVLDNTSNNYVVFFLGITFKVYEDYRKWKYRRADLQDFQQRRHGEWLYLIWTGEYIVK